MQEIAPSRKTPRFTKPPAIVQTIKKLTILIPCYNEERTIALLLDKVCDVELPYSIQKEVIVINDFSRDDTDLIIKEYIEDNPDAPITYLHHEYNQGKGVAIRSGLRLASGDYIIIQDADLEYDPAEYGRLLDPIVKGHADIVYGSRFTGGHPHRILFFWHTIGNKILTFISNALTNMNLTDAHTCYKVIPVKVLRDIPLMEKRFAFDSELNAKIARVPGLRLYEVGISYYGRTFKDGKKIRLRDAVRSVYSLIKYTLFRRKK